MKANYNGIEFDFAIRKKLDGNAVKGIWDEDYYRLEEIQKSGAEIKSVLEIGGHIGCFAVLAAVLWPAASVRTYEAWEENYTLLVKHCSGFSNIFPFNIAVIGSDEEVVSFRLPHLREENTGDGRIDNPYMDNSHFNEGIIQVKACSIWKVVAECDVIDLLKLDCEGSELVILEALKDSDVIRQIRWIRGEWHGGNANRDRVQAFLSKTHKIEFEKTNQSYGLFWAEAK